MVDINYIIASLAFTLVGLTNNLFRELQTEFHFTVDIVLILYYKKNARIQYVVLFHLVEVPQSFLSTKRVAAGSYVTMTGRIVGLDLIPSEEAKLSEIKIITVIQIKVRLYNL